MMQNGRFRDWLLWEFCATLIMLIAMWPLGKWLANRSDSFYEAFANGDLILFCAIGLLGIYVEQQALKESGSHSQRIECAWISSICHLIGVIVLFAYGGIKIFMLSEQPMGHRLDCQLELPRSESSHCDDLNMIALIGGASVVATFIFGASFHVLAASKRTTGEGS